MPFSQQSCCALMGYIVSALTSFVVWWLSISLLHSNAICNPEIPTIDKFGLIDVMQNIFLMIVAYGYL